MDATQSYTDDKSGKLVKCGDMAGYCEVNLAECGGIDQLNQYLWGQTTCCAMAATAAPTPSPTTVAPTAAPTTPPMTVPAAVTATTVAGSFTVEMSKEHATAFTSDAKAKSAFKTAFASTIGVDQNEVIIKAIYVDGEKIARRLLELAPHRRLAMSSVKVDYEVTSAQSLTAASTIDVAKLKTSIIEGAKSIGYTIAITSDPVVTTPAAVTVTQKPGSTNEANSAGAVFTLAWAAVASGLSSICTFM